jgi:hypothetical protein
MQLAVDGARQDLRLAHHQLIVFAPHHLDQDGQLQLAAPHHLERIVAQFLHPDGNVGQQFLVEPLAQIAGGHVGALPAGERRRVDGERHGDGGLVDLHLGQRAGILGAGDGFADGDAFHAGDGQKVAGPADGFVHPLQAFERVQLGDAGGVLRAVQLADGHGVAEAQRAGEDAPDGQAPQVVAVIQVGDQHLQHLVRIARRLGDMPQDGVEQRLQVGRGSSMEFFATPVLATV